MANFEVNRKVQGTRRSFCKHFYCQSFFIIKITLTYEQIRQLHPENLIYEKDINFTDEGHIKFK